jgi:diguanylate cyclase (GGDEF)-like protein
VSRSESAESARPAGQDRRRLQRNRRLPILAYEALVSIPLVALLVLAVALHPSQFVDWHILAWAAAIAVVDLLPVPTSVSMAFSLSFPLELSVALLYPNAAVPAVIAFLGASDQREFRREIPFMKALFIRSQIALAVSAEATVFHSLASLEAPWYVLGPTVLLAAVAGYSVNTLLVAYYFRLQSRRPLLGIIREMHVGVFGEFVLAYMGLALFSVLVAISTRTIGVWAILVFVAPLAFARQMFRRTHSLQAATQELAAKQAENEFQALHDSLTGMPNRVLFQQRLTNAIDDAATRRLRLAVMLIDLDHFKEINDTLGHQFGDLLLQQIGPRLSTVLREHDVLARLGGDEFGILLPDVPNEDVVRRIAERVQEELERPIVVEGLALDVAGSVGIALYPDQASDAETLLRRADVSMYAAKEAGGGGFEIYHEDLDRHSPHRLTLVGQIRPALENGEFEVHFQPKVRLSDGRVSGAEALVRWRHPTMGLIPPDEFVPLIEKTVLLRPFTLHVVERTLDEWRVWADMGIRLPIAVNLSTRSLMDLQLPDHLAELLIARDVPPAYLRLELTESFLMADSTRSSGVLDRLARVGVGMSIDDFGTGYSSLSYLRRLPIEEIKIDRSFVMQMQVDANDFAIVHATVELGRNLGLRVVAEGVEDIATFDKLAEFGCDEAQGFYISRPMPADEFARWLSVRNLDAATEGDATRQRRQDLGRLRVV